jgi:hypothetical protein
MVETSYQSIGIDTLEDYQKALRWLQGWGRLDLLQLCNRLQKGVEFVFNL